MGPLITQHGLHPGAPSPRLLGGAAAVPLGDFRRPPEAAEGGPMREPSLPYHRPSLSITGQCISISCASIKMLRAAGCSSVFIRGSNFFFSVSSAALCVLCVPLSAFPIGSAQHQGA